MINLNKSWIKKFKEEKNNLKEFYEMANKNLLLDKKINSVISINPNLKEEYEKLSKIDLLKTKLKGIPILIKDNISTKDWITSAGSLDYKDYKPKQNAPIIDKLIQNGGVFINFKIKVNSWKNKFTKIKFRYPNE
jgi:Asp-tRNA(Asn)/Glu-tRNA(Gln) amidotransferase A subunit family amidase